MKRAKKYEDHKYAKLREFNYAKTYLESAIEEYHSDHNRAAFLLALRDLVEAQGGIADFSEKIHLSRQALYKSLSPAGNPRFETLDNVLNRLGFQFTVEPLKKKHV